MFRLSDLKIAAVRSYCVPMLMEPSRSGITPIAGGDTYNECSSSPQNINHKSAIHSVLMVRSRDHSGNKQKLIQRRCFQ